MSVIGTGSSRVIVDVDGEAATVTNGKLDVNAGLTVEGDINIGNVDVLTVPAPLNVTGGGTESSALRVTIANDSTGVLTVDGTVAVTHSALTELGNAIYTEDSTALSMHYGIPPLAVRRDSMTVGAAGDGDFISLSTDAVGHLYVTEGSTFTYTDYPMLDVDNSANALSVVDSGAVGVVSNCVEIFLQADESNTGYIMVGGESSVADNRGMKLNPGDTIILNVNDTRAVGVWGSAANQNLRCMIATRYT
tara:strand:- start:5 stop:751 length:747 start_codon:yes stop_codon:yes gene_type:complete